MDLPMSNPENPPIRAKIRRLYIPNAIYFITGVTKNREPHFNIESRIDLLRQTIHSVKELHRFKMLAYVFLFDHLHILIHLHPETNISKLLGSIQRNYTVNFKKVNHINESISLWQKGFWDHVIRDDRDFINHFHYIHYNPVKHGYVQKPEDYPHSSYLEYVKRGWYEIGWGWQEPENLRGIDFE